MPRKREPSMPTPANLFRLLNEFILLLLGALLILLAVTRGVMLPSKPSALLLLGIALIYWGARAGMRRGGSSAPNAARGRQIRSSSLLFVGLVVACIPLAPLRYAEPLLIVAGAVLMVRGILSAILYARAS
jgi:hypothetical protein